MRRFMLLVWATASASALLYACSTDDAGGSGATGGSGTSSGAAGSGPDASDAPLDTSASCTDGVKGGTETDVDCGGSDCPPCAEGKQCGGAADCIDGICSGTCQAPTCSDGVTNGGEKGVDCGGPCPATYHGTGCIQGTNGSMVCSFFEPADAGVDDAGAAHFTVEMSWNAAGGNGFVDYGLVYGPNNTVINSQGIVGGGAVNICTSGPHTDTFQLPLGDMYMWKIWHADCVNPNACSGCGSDVVVAEGGPFGVAEDPCP